MEAGPQLLSVCGMLIRGPRDAAWAASADWGRCAADAAAQAAVAGPAAAVIPSRHAPATRPVARAVIVLVLMILSSACACRASCRGLAADRSERSPLCPV